MSGPALAPFLTKEKPRPEIDPCWPRATENIDPAEPMADKERSVPPESPRQVANGRSRASNRCALRPRSRGRPRSPPGWSAPVGSLDPGGAGSGLRRTLRTWLARLLGRSRGAHGARLEADDLSLVEIAG